MPQLLLDFAQVFTTAEVFSPLDLAARNYTWPSIDAMVADGKRLMVVSGVDYLAPMAPLIFSRCAADVRILVRTCPLLSATTPGPPSMPLWPMASA